MVRRWSGIGSKELEPNPIPCLRRTVSALRRARDDNPWRPRLVGWAPPIRA